MRTKSIAFAPRGVDPLGHPTATNRSCEQPMSDSEMPHDGSRPAPTGYRNSVTSANMSDDLVVVCARPRRQMNVRPTTMSQPSSGQGAGGASRGPRGGTAVPMSPSAGLLPVWRRPSWPSPDPESILGRAGSLAQTCPSKRRCSGWAHRSLLNRLSAPEQRRSQCAGTRRSPLRCWGVTGVRAAAEKTAALLEQRGSRRSPRCCVRTVV
jgi:hypothetical protein